MSWLATGIYLAGVATAFGLRSWLHRRATGDSGHRFGRPRACGAEWWAQILFGLALVLGAVAPVLAATGVVGPMWTRSGIQVAGLVVALAGFAAVVAAQHAMGRSWRVGVDPGERTELVEEPYLRRVHGASYRDYTQRVGRFVPGVGRRAVMRGG